MSIEVSVITPVHNGVRTIDRTICSVLEQTESNWEHLIIDDGSQDDTPTVVGRHQDDRVRYHIRPHMGRSAARNHGISLARGKYLLFLDADDWLLPGALHDHLAFLNSSPQFGVSVSDGWFCTDAGEPIVTLSSRRGLAASGDVLQALVVDPGLVGGIHAAMVRGDVVRRHQLGFPPELMIGEDWLFWIHVARYTQFGFLPSLTCVYRWHPHNTSRSSARDVRQDQLWRVHQQIMALDRFPKLPVETRDRFFYTVLIDLLTGRPDEQAGVLKDLAFVSLPAQTRARLLGLAATEYLARGERVEASAEWLRSARALAPRDVKLLLLSLLTQVHYRLATALVRLWRMWGAAQSGRHKATYVSLES